MFKSIDINCDVGEGLNNETELMPYISSCNIACGGHAGNDETMINTIKLAIKHKVKIGAHPSFPDPHNFGRKIMNMNPVELQTCIEDQILRLSRHIDALGAKLHHVKAHGALYNLAAIDKQTAKVLVKAVANTTINTSLYAPCNSLLIDLARQKGVKVVKEAFGDRNYNTNATLVSRKLEGAVLKDKEKVVRHLLQMIKKKEVLSIDGVGVHIEAETFCIHGDNPNAKEVVKHLVKELFKEGFKLNK